MKIKKQIIIFIVLILILILFLSYYFCKNEVYFQDYITFFKLYDENKHNENSDENLNLNDIFYSNTYFKENSFISSDKLNNQKNYSFSLNELELQMKTVNLIDTVDSKTLINEKIAPGTKGSFNINVISNQSTNYKIKFESKNKKPKYLIFYKENSNKKYQNIEDMQNELDGYINAKEERQIKINWEWQYETKENNILQDKQDTNDAQEIQSYSFGIYVIGL